MSTKLKILTSVLIINLITLIILLCIDIHNDSTKLEDDITPDSAYDIEVTESLDERMEDYLAQDTTEISLEQPGKIGHITVNGTVINYPLMYSTDLMYYTQHNSTNKVDNNGAIFLDSRITDFDNKVLLIHGLVTDDNMMFSDLVKYEDNNWASEHTILQLQLQQSYTNYQLFSVVIVDGEEPVIYLEHADELAYENFYNTLCAQSNYTCDNNFSADKRMIILNTVDKNNKHYLICFLEVL